MPIQQTNGNAAYDSYGGGVAAVPNYIEEVFSAYTYTGNGSTQTINNGIDLSTKGGLVWLKRRINAGYDHELYDTARGVTNYLQTDNNFSQGTSVNGLSAFNANGFTLANTRGNTNESGIDYVSWTFRKQPKFFDIVTYTGTGSARTITHALASTPGCIIVKRTDTTGDWQVYHSGLTSAAYAVQLNLTNAQASDSTIWNATAPTSAVFSVGTNATVNASGGTYVAYIFASNAGGFGLTGTDNVITCGSFTTDGAARADVNLGWEPQFVLQKASTATQGWYLTDSSRGATAEGGQMAQLFPNTSGAESSGTGGAHPTATGFVSTGLQVSQTFIYIAIRRGPMRVPTDGTKVYSAIAITGNDTVRVVSTVGFQPDLIYNKARTTSYGNRFTDRLRGAGLALQPDTTSAEVDNTGTSGVVSFSSSMTGFTIGTANPYNASPETYIYDCFKRAPGFLDEVCYTGTGANATISHNLGIAPEFMIIKGRNLVSNWICYQATLGAGFRIGLSGNGTPTTDTDVWQNTIPSANNFYLGVANGGTIVNNSGSTYVAYLFASCPGVSKVGSYTGNGTTQTIDCGFTGGARFILIKRTDSTGDWYTYDTVRGMTTLTDPYLLLNSSAAETATLGSVTTVATGFAVNAAILAAINTNAATYIFLAIA